MPDDDDAIAVKPFAAVLQEQREGALHTELSDEFAELVRACMQTGKKGSLTLKITCAPQSDETTMHVTGEVKSTPPRPTVRPSLFWPDENGNLQRSDPRQLDMSTLREVRGSAKPTAVQEARTA